MNQDSRIPTSTIDEKRARLAELLRQQGQRPATAHPLSEGQRALWFLHQVAPSSSAFNIAFTARIVSAVDEDALRRAWDALVARHDSLRSRIAMADGNPVQQVDPAMTAPFEVVARGWSGDRILTEIAAEIRRPFDLASGPLLRIRLYVSDSGESFLAATFHHIAFDGWSLWICLSELPHLYAAALRGEEANLARPTTRFSAYVRAEADIVAGPAAKRHEAFWRDKFGAGNLPVLNLPTDRVRPPTPRYAGASHRFELDAQTTERLRRIAQQERGTLQMAVLSLFVLLLHRYSAQSDFVVGYLAAGRVRAEFEDLVGYLANALPLPCTVPAEGTFRDLLSRTKATLLDAFDHQEFPFTRVLDAVKVSRDSSRSPLFQTLFVFEKPHVLEDQDLAAFIVGEPGARITLGDLVFESLPFSAQQEGQFDLTFVAVERRGALACSIDFSTDLFDASTIQRLAGHWQQLAKSAADAPDAPLATLPLLTRHEVETLDRWNATERDVPALCFHEIVAAHAARQPDAPAVVFGDEVISYAELNARANRFARHLQQLGVGPDVIVGLCVERSSTLIMAALGILKAGGAFLPLDPAYPAERLAFMIDDSKVHLLVTQQSLVGRVGHTSADLVLVDRDERLWASQSAANVSGAVTPESLMYVIYTSGSTGKPKGVLLQHRGLVNVAAEQQRMFGVGPGAQVLQFAALSFDAAVFEIAMALGSGATLHMARQEELLPGLPLLDTLRRRAINVVTLPPSALMNVPQADLPHLSTITVAGEACPAELVSRWAGGRAFFNLYGPTEATIWSTAFRCTSGEGTPTIGHAIANTHAYVLDNNLRRVPIGVPGELHLGGVGLARGYLGRPELTASKFIPNPFEPDGRLYKTGDLVRFLPTGELEFLGRIDHQVKVRGFRIELGEIETALAQHVDVHETVVTVREDTPGAPRVVAYVVAKDSRPTPDALKAFVRAKLPEFMVPSAVVFLDALPISPAGKVDRGALPSPAEATSRQAPKVPTTSTEEHIARVWKDVLKVEHIGIDDNFFDIGGSSLLLAQVHARLSPAAESPALSILDMFQLPTIRELAARLGPSATPAAPAPERGDVRSGQARLREQARRRAGERGIQ